MKEYMREYRIIVDLSKKLPQHPFICYGRDTATSIFQNAWDFLEDLPSHQEALDYVNGLNGRFVGSFMKDGTQLAENMVITIQRAKPKQETVPSPVQTPSNKK